MTEPLIDWDVLFELIDGAVTKHLGRATTGPARDAADDVLTYLREVLTPEALNAFHGNETIPVFSTGDGMYHRIFGEDK